MKLNLLAFLSLAITLIACYEPVAPPDWSKSVAPDNQLVQRIIVDLNSSFGNSTVIRGTVNARIGSYKLTNASSEDVKISAFAITMNANASSFQNLRARIGSVQIGQTYSTLSPVERYVFSPYGSFVMPANVTIAIDFYSDVSANVVVSTLITQPSATSWASCSGIGMTTGDTIFCVGNPNGQRITITAP